MEDQNNPWYVKNLEEFMYYCCPECDEKKQSRDLFLKHALGQHPNSKECLQEFAIKEEDFSEDNVYISETTDHSKNNSITDNAKDYLHCYIKEEDEVDENNYDSNTENDDLNTSEKHFKHFGNDKDEKDIICDSGKKDAFTDGIKVETEKVTDKVKDKNCDQCGKSFQYPNHLEIHIKTVHEGKRDYKCETCGKAYGRSSVLNRHIKIAHLGQKVESCKTKKIKCDQCEKLFYHPNHLKIHIKTVHQGIKDQKCEICGKAFGRTS